MDRPRHREGPHHLPRPRPPSHPIGPGGGGQGVAVGFGIRKLGGGGGGREIHGPLRIRIHESLHTPPILTIVPLFGGGLLPSVLLVSISLGDGWSRSTHPPQLREGSNSGGKIVPNHLFLEQGSQTCQRAARLNGPPIGRRGFPRAGKGVPTAPTQLLADIQFGFEKGPPSEKPPLPVFCNTDFSFSNNICIFTWLKFKKTDCL